jgi:hypothetical protein
MGKSSLYSLAFLPATRSARLATPGAFVLLACIGACTDLGGVGPIPDALPPGTPLGDAAAVLEAGAAQVAAGLDASESSAADAGAGLPVGVTPPDASAGGPGRTGFDAGSGANDGATDSASSDPGLRDGQADAIWAPLPTNGEPLEATRGAWTYTEMPDTQCRDGSPAGLFVNLGTSAKLLIFMQGGGRCVDEPTCSSTPASVNDLQSIVLRTFTAGGILDRSRLENPVRDWNFVMVPYCTGDRHGGANADAEVSGVGPQKMVGHLNMKAYLKRIVPTFPEPSDVLFTGISAGGFGVAYNAVLVQRAFPKVKVKLVIDSAPFVTKAAFSECDQARTRELYKAEQTFLGDCGAACPRPNDYWFDFGLFFARTFQDRPAGLIVSTEDAVERALFGIGADDCSAPFDLLNPALPAAVLRSDILAYREAVRPFSNFGTFYPEGDMHTFIPFDDFFTSKAGGVSLLDWFAKIVRGETPGHAGP